MKTLFQWQKCTSCFKECGKVGSREEQKSLSECSTIVVSTNSNQKIDFVVYSLMLRKILQLCFYFVAQKQRQHLESVDCWSTNQRQMLSSLSVNSRTVINQRDLVDRQPEIPTQTRLITADWNEMKHICWRGALRNHKGKTVETLRVVEHQ